MVRLKHPDFTWYVSLVVIGLIKLEITSFVTSPRKRDVFAIRTLNYASLQSCQVVVVTGIIKGEIKLLMATTWI